MKEPKGLPSFFNDNFIQFHSIEPDSKLTALRRGLMDYYETYSICLSTSNNKNYNSSLYEYFNETKEGISLSQIKGHSFLIGYFSSIVFIHLSFEQFLFEVLETQSPILAKLNLDKQFDLIKTLTGEIKNEPVKNRKYVDYSVALNRVQQLIEKDNILPPKFRLNNKYHFLKDHIETLKQLSILRNDIIHSGKQMLNRYTYEFFFVNQLMPLIREYLNVNPPSPYLERELHCKKNVINEISNEKLPENYNDPNNYKDLCKSLKRINHFKELGRASFHNPINMLESIVNEEQKKMIEENHNKPLRENADLFVNLKQEKLGHYDMNICPCCGTKSLTSFDSWTYLIDNKTKLHTAECVVCSYRVNINIGEPKDFGIMGTELFKFID